MGVHVSPILNPLPTPSPSHPSGLSQCTPHLLLKVFLPHLFLGNMNLSISKVDSFSRSIKEKIMVAMTGYFAFIHCYQVQPSHSQPSSLRALSLCSVSTMGPQPRHLLRGFSSGSSHPLPGSLNFLSGSSFSSPRV